jgi:spore coat polysaccharide biosynthesis protein SpsF
VKIPGFVTVRTASTRLPRKCLMPFGEGNVLEHIIRRAQFFNFDPIVCTTTLPEDNIVEQIGQKEGCRVYRGSARDKLLRWVKACETFGIEAFHTIDADDPFYDGELGHRSFKMLDEGYDIIYPSNAIYVGGVGYSIKTDIIQQACVRKKSEDTEMMWYFVEKVPGVKKTELPVPDARTSRIRLTLDYQEDYWMLCSVLRILGPHTAWKEVEELFIRNPDLYKVNWFRNEQWKGLQEAKGKEAR